MQSRPLRLQIGAHLVLVFALVQVSFGQSQATHRRESSFDQTPKPIAIDPGQPLNISVSNLNEYSVVALEPAEATAGHDLQLRAWIIRYNENQKAFLSWQRLDGIDKLADEQSEIKNGTLTIDGAAAASQRTVIHLSVPSGTVIRLEANGKLIHSGPVTSGLMCQNGLVIPSNEGYAPHVAIFRALKGGELLP
jgi:hypothetical protein